MRLKELLKDIYQGPLDEAFGQYPINAVCDDSRKAEKNSLFVAVKGATFNGNDFIDRAIDKGARVIATSEDVTLSEHPEVCCIKIDDPQKFLRDIAGRFYGNPSESVRTIGITGTNGKTTIAYIVESIINEAGFDCGVVGTVNYRLGDKVQPSLNTTPAFLDNQKFLHQVAKEKIEYCVMEVSSHALDQGRVDLIDFKVAAFTNLTSDHLDYHETRENYFEVKSRLFKNLSTDATAVINVDDPYGSKLVSMTEAEVVTYGIKNNADVMAKDVQLSLSGTQFKLIYPEGEANIRSSLVGAYNVYNMLTAIAACWSEGISIEKIRLGIEHLKAVPGRLESVDCGQNFSIFIDYAHTQDALENVLTTMHKTSDAKIIVVFGCGGDRDKTKRPQMGKVAGQLADYAIVTSDNPRTEDPQVIIDDILPGFEGDNYEVIVDREKAIAKALKIAQEGDIVLIAGKGHETYQMFQDATINFDERQVVRNILLC